MAKKLLIAAALLVTASIALIVFDRTGTDYQRAPEIDAVAERPPAPDFFESVDYVAWMNQQFAAGKPPGSSEAYRRFWPEPSAGEDGMPKPSKTVREQLLTLTTGPEWQRGQHSTVEGYLSSVASFLDLFKAEVDGASSYRFVPKPDKQDPRNPMLVLLPRIDGSRHVIPCLLALAWRQGADRQSRLLEAWRLGILHAKHLQESNQLILIRTALAVRLTVYESMRAAASLDELNDEGIEVAICLLSDVDPVSPNLRQAIRIEWGGTLGFVQALCKRPRQP